LKPSGTLVLALPDKRLCFDFFQPLTTTGQLLDANGCTRHSHGVLYDFTAYAAGRGGNDSWRDDCPIELTQSFATARDILAVDTSNYIDTHKWRFTPASFRLLVLELNLLRVIPWAIERLEPAAAVEFYAWLKQREINLSAEEISSQRLHLLEETVRETKAQVVQLDSPRISKGSAGPAISAIIPLYNGARFIEPALRSVLAQSTPPQEIIVVDDGSTDDSPAVIQALAEQYPITLLSKHNGGQSSARNLGVAHSTGDLIAFLDQDDLWYPHHLEQLVQPFLQPAIGAELGWVYSDLDEIDIDGLMVCNCYLRTLPTEHPKSHLFSCLREDMFILPSASLVSREAFDAVGGFDEQLSGYEDDDLFLRLFRAGYANVFLPQALSQWRIFPESSSYSYRMRRSRAAYARKLLATYHDDPARKRYLQRDLILPRFYGHAMVEYRNALLSRDANRIEETREELLFLVNLISPGGRIIGWALSMVRSHMTARLAFAAGRFAWPLVRRFT